MQAPSLFFLIIRRPPRSPLFPNTALFRSRGRGSPVPPDRDSCPSATPSPSPPQIREETVPSAAGRRSRARAPARSEEHTSELQSRQYLVCRLLLEKKKVCCVPTVDTIGRY